MIIRKYRKFRISTMMMVRPYEPPPDYPVDEEPRYRNRSIPIQTFPSVAGGAEGERRRHHTTQGRPPAHPSCRSSHDAEMLRTRQYPEIAGLYCGEDQVPALRRFTRYNQSMIHRDPAPPVQTREPATTFGKSTKKTGFFSGNWTFRDKKSSSRPALPMQREEQRPVSVNLSDVRGTRSRSEGGRHIDSEFGSCRIPIRVERPTEDNSRSSNRVLFRSQPPPEHKSSAPATLSPYSHFDESRSPSTNSSGRGSIESPTHKLSSPELSSFDHQRAQSKKRNRRAKEKQRDAHWRRTPVADWSLDDVLLWLQHIHLDEVASLLIGYDIKGDDLLKFDQKTLGQLGISDSSTQTKILSELEIVKKAPTSNDTETEKSRQQQRSMFDLVKQTSYDQVLAVETPLTTRDVTVTGGRMGCLQITKVDGSKLPLKENDCLLEINNMPGEQFKSALMLTKLISDSNGAPIRFVVLRRKAIEDDAQSQADSSSGVSSSPLTPVENV